MAPPLYLSPFAPLTLSFDFPDVNHMQQNIFATVLIELLPTAQNERHVFEAKQMHAQRREETGLVEQPQAEAPGTAEEEQKEKQVRTAREEEVDTCTTRLT